MDRLREDLFGALRKAAAVQILGRLSDRELINRFLQQHQEEAFTVLIDRHGPMVYGVCHRSLANRHDAEDAFQATFLVLSRKLATLRKKDSLAGWLHRIASRTASNLKRSAVRRRRMELVLQGRFFHDRHAESTSDENSALLDEELELLPERYRAPLILCYLQQMSRETAAVTLGLTLGSLHGRLERARAILKKRLTNRGFNPALVNSLVGVHGPILLPATMVTTSARAAAGMALGRTISELVGSKVLKLTQEILRAMVMTKMKCVTGILLTVCVLSQTAGHFLASGVAQDTPKEIVKQGKADGVEDDGAFIRRLSKDLRGNDPTPTEVHFFVNIKDPDKREKLINLLNGERKNRKEDNQITVLPKSVYEALGTMLFASNQERDYLSHLEQILHILKHQLNKKNETLTQGESKTNITPELLMFDTILFTMTQPPKDVVPVLKQLIKSEKKDYNPEKLIYEKKQSPINLNRIQTVLLGVDEPRVNPLFIGKNSTAFELSEMMGNNDGRRCKKIVIARTDDKGLLTLLTVDIKAIREKGDTSTNYLLQSGDRLIIEYESPNPAQNKKPKLGVSSPGKETGGGGVKSPLPGKDTAVDGDASKS